MKIKSKTILPHVYLLIYPTQYDLCMSLVRMQEFYESPKFKGKYFTLEEYIDYWCKEFGNGSFTYPSTWNGFNLPSETLKEWVGTFYFDIRARELAVFKAIEKLLIKDGDDGFSKYYVIAVHEESSKKEMDQAKEHETAHALYYLYPEYKESCKRLLDKISRRKYIDDRKFLLKTGYCNSVLDDELQSYYSCEEEYYASPVRPEFVKNFSDFKKKLIKNAGK